MCHGILFAASVVNDGMPAAEFTHPNRIYYAHVFHLMELLQLCDIFLVTDFRGS